LKIEKRKNFHPSFSLLSFLFQTLTRRKAAFAAGRPPAIMLLYQRPVTSGQMTEDRKQEKQGASRLGKDGSSVLYFLSSDC